jgi:hypothetical protein
MAAGTGLGYSLMYGDTAETISQEIAGILTINTLDPEVAVATAAPLDSETARKINAAGSVQEGALDCEALHDDVQFSDLHELLRAMKFWKATFPDGGSITFEGFLHKGPKCVVSADDFMKDSFGVHVRETISIENGG